MSNLGEMLAAVGDLSIFRAVGNGSLKLLVASAICVSRFLVCGEVAFFVE